MIFSLRLIQSTDFSATVVVGVLKSAKTENPKIRLAINIITEPTISAASAATKVFQKFRFDEFYDYTLVILLQRYKKKLVA